MARRYSGSVVVEVTWSDNEDQYVGRVITPEGSSRQSVRAPAILEHAVDSPVAYDAAAHAMLSFSESDLAKSGIALDAHALFEPDGSGWTVCRKKDHSAKRVERGNALAERDTNV